MLLPVSPNWRAIYSVSKLSVSVQLRPILSDFVCGKSCGKCFLGGLNKNSARVGGNGSETVRERGREAVGVIHSFILFCSSNQQNYKW